VSDPYWGSEIDLLELGPRFYAASDEASVVEHRLAQALGIEYGSPPRHWSWR
jgi:hypothetical protein